MANLRRWSSSASGNATVTGGVNTINFAEGQTPGSVNNSAREMMAQVRSIYTPAEWGWVEHSATASVASQTAFKISGNQTTNWTAGRRWRLKSASTTRYGSVVSSSFTAETTITVTVDSGSLSASHSLAALAAIDSNNVPPFAAGTAALPSISTVGDTNTGWWFPAADTIAASTGGSERMRIDSIGNVGIGAAPSANFDVKAATVVSRIESTTGTNTAQFRVVNTGGTFYFGLDSSTGANFGAAYGGVLWHSGAYPILIATNNTERMRIDSSGNVIVTGAGGLGYGTGSGGTVTQITSRATGVTINKTNGSITLFTGAPSAVVANNTFTVTNSTVAATDTIVLSFRSGNSSSNAYVLYASAVAAGSFNVAVFSTSGTTSDTPIINFAVIKAVTA
jgi:hypothetical protein